MKRLFLILAGLLAPSSALAISINSYGWNCAGFLHCGDGQDAVVAIATNVTVGVTATIAAAAVIAVLYGAIRMATSQGGEGKDAGKKAIIYGAVGLVAAILAAGIITYVTQFVFSVATS